ncbi:MAG TPA: hypothetical protein VNS63_10795 [Blastocatellia bacterium]|nr:hypothetical protein [Blastocatellia bacterium]
MGLQRSDLLKDGITRLLEDVGPLNTISGVGFLEADRAKVEDSLARVRAVEDWTYVDLRGCSSTECSSRLDAAWNASVMVLAIRPPEIPVPISLLIRGVVDRKTSIDLGDGRPRHRTPNQSIVILTDGFNRFANAAVDLERISIWQMDWQLE